jgi:hypothetical protein
MRFPFRSLKRGISVFVFAVCVTVGAQERDFRPTSLQSAYLDGEEVAFRIAPASRGKRPLVLGPWQFGVPAEFGKPRDGRLNLYLVSPGSGHRVPGWDEFDHNGIVNTVPARRGAVLEWDVYWAIVLDPKLHDELRSEHDLLVAMQAGFRPHDLLEFDDIPGRAFLRTFLEIDSLRGLRRFRRRDGRLPRVVIVPAGFAIRAGAERRTVAKVAARPRGGVRRMTR